MAAQEKSFETMWKNSTNDHDTDTTLPCTAS